MKTIHLLKKNGIVVAIVLLCSLLFSCKKKIFEEIPLLHVEKNMNIPNGGNIKHFSFPSELIAYAASDSSFIYKTTDGGQNWVKLSWVNNACCKGIEFFDENNGMCLMNNTVYVTSNGGQNWTPKLNADFIAISDDGLRGICGKCPNDVSCEISITTDKGQNFSLTGLAPIRGAFSFAEMDGNSIILFGSEVFYYDFVHGYDITSGTITQFDFSNITDNETPRDFYVSGGKGFLVGESGMIQDNLNSGLYSRKYYMHNYTYRSADGFGQTAICVGDKTITTNLSINDNTDWKEAVDKDKNGFKENFYKVKCISERSFYLSGSNGLLIRAKL